MPRRRRSVGAGGLGRSFGVSKLAPSARPRLFSRHPGAGCARCSGACAPCSLSRRAGPCRPCPRAAGPLGPGPGALTLSQTREETLLRVTATRRAPKRQSPAKGLLDLPKAEGGLNDKTAKTEPDTGENGERGSRGVPMAKPERRRNSLEEVTGNANTCQVNKHLSLSLTRVPGDRRPLTTTQLPPYPLSEGGSC